MKRHFTATGFVVKDGATLLHWHKRLEQWMPPGGHIEINEDPATGVLREVLEETGLSAEIIPSVEPLPVTYPGQIPAPYIILLEDIPDPGDPHQHIDLIYFCRPVDDVDPEPVADPTLRWFTEEELARGNSFQVAGRGISALIPEDVRQLALIAIKAERDISVPNSTF